MRLFTSLFLFVLWSTSVLAQTSLVPVTFIVTDFDTDKEILNALVTVRQTALTQQTVSGGKVRFENVPVGEIEYFIQKEGYQLSTGRVNVSTDTRTNVFRVPMSKIDDKKILVTGEVTDSEGRDLADALVEIKLADQIKTVKTDNSGNYSAYISPSTKYQATNLRIEVKKGDCKKTETVEIPITNVVYKDLKLECGTSKIGDNNRAPNNTVCKEEDMPYVLQTKSIKLEFCQCYYFSSKIVCPLTVKNLTSQVVNTYLAGDRTSRVILDGGKDFPATNAVLMYVSSGTQRGASASIPVTKNGVRGSVTFENIQTNSTTIESLEIKVSNGFKSFSNVPLVHGRPKED